MFDGAFPISGVLEETSIIRRETPAGEVCPGETPQAHRRRGRTALGKRVPGA